MTGQEARVAYTSFGKPKLADLLGCLKLDAVYVRGRGSELWREDGRVVADFVGGFGAALAGHNHPALKQVLTGALAEDRPQHAQGSIPASAAALAQALSLRAPGHAGYYCCLTNSGAEAVEAALKHAYKVRFDRMRREFDGHCRQVNAFYYQALERGGALELPEGKTLLKFRDDLDQHNLAQFEAFQDRPVVLAFKGAFHGKTASALKVTFNKSFREGYQGLSAIHPIFLDPAEPGRIPAILETEQSLFYTPDLVDGRVELRAHPCTRVLALIFEPILGEGGVRPLPAATLEALAAHHAAWGLPYIVDEIQTGCGRTGTFLHLEQTPLKSIAPDYLLLGKALGGGLVKIGACLIRRDIYDQDFGILHSSTFAEDELSSRVALRFLGLLEEDHGALLNEVAAKGAALKAGLEGLRMEFPGLVKEVRGAGLMLALEFTDMEDRSPFFRLSGRQGILSLLVASHLLEVHGLRVLAPLTTMMKGNPGKARPSILRIQPPACVTAEQIQGLIGGLRQALRAIDANNERCLISHLFAGSVPEAERLAPRRLQNTWPAGEQHGPLDARSAFVIHPLSLADLEAYFFPSFQGQACDKAALKDWWVRMGRFLEPAHVRDDRINAHGFVVQNSLILLPYLPDTILAAKEPALVQELRDKIQDAVTLAKELGDENVPQSMVGLGAFSSIATDNGLTLNDHAMAVTTGNAFTVAAALQGLGKAVEARGVDLAACTASVVGAGGNIGQALAQALAPSVRRLILIGSSKPSSLARLEATRGLCAGLGADLELATELGPLRRSQVVLVATSAGDAGLIHPDLLPDGAVVCSVSVPGNLSPDFLDQDRVLAFDGGMAQLPPGSSVRFLGLPADGGVHGCLGETLLLALQGHNHSFSQGPVDLAKVAQTLAWAGAAGFSLGPLRLHGKVVLP